MPKSFDISRIPGRSAAVAAFLFAGAFQQAFGQLAGMLATLSELGMFARGRFILHHGILRANK